MDFTPYQFSRNQNQEENLEDEVFNVITTILDTKNEHPEIMKKLITCEKNPHENTMFVHNYIQTEKSFYHPGIFTDNMLYFYPNLDQ